jgi:hypothetical protein
MPRPFLWSAKRLVKDRESHRSCYKQVELKERPRMAGRMYGDQEEFVSDGRRESPGVKNARYL